MKLDEHREILCSLALPLDLLLVAALGSAIGDAVEALGYRDVVILTDGTNRIVASRPARGES